MKRYLLATACAAAALLPALAQAEPSATPAPPAPPAPVAPVLPPAPALGAGCPADLDDTMTLLPDEQTYAICQQGPVGFTWNPAPIPFEPHERWWSYGPQINLHGQGMRNPNVTSGRWTATPQDPETLCRAEQQTVVEAGVLSEPRVDEGQPDEDLAVEFLPKLFCLKLSGNCVWTKGS